jgi:hypothetical protein
MGFPLRSNIFKYGTNEQERFASFPVQVAVLFSPQDQQFIEAFREVFLHLDQLTSDEVAFFAVLDPPQDWINSASGRNWWTDYQAQFGKARFTYDDEVLVREIARLFRVSWGLLPAIVVGTNLWTGEFITSPTSVWTIERQLEALTKLVREWGRPNIDHIDQVLSELSSDRSAYHPPNDELRYRISTVYGVMDTVREDYFDRNQYHKYLQTELRTISSVLSRLRQNSTHVVNISDNLFVDELLEDVAGRLVIPATVAMRVWQALRREDDIPLDRSLDEESLIMIKTALRVGNFLEIDRDFDGSSSRTDVSENFPNRATQRPMISPRPPRRRDSISSVRNQDMQVDFTPGAQGVWKAFEREINLSVIQAARASRNVTMPDFFNLYDPNPKVLGRVQTGRDRSGRPIFRDINQLDRRDLRSQRHKFLSLGDALFVIKALHSRSTERFDLIVSSCLGSQLDPCLLGIWEKICEIRNRSSHVESLTHADYQEVLEKVLSHDLLNPLMKIKQCLST